MFTRGVAWVITYDPWRDHIICPTMQRPMHQPMHSAAYPSKKSQSDPTQHIHIRTTWYCWSIISISFILIHNCLFNIFAIIYAPFWLHLGVQLNYVLVSAITYGAKLSKLGCGSHSMRWGGSQCWSPRWSTLTWRRRSRRQARSTCCDGRTGTWQWQWTSSWKSAKIHQHFLGTVQKLLNANLTRY